MSSRAAKKALFLAVLLIFSFTVTASSGVVRVYSEVRTDEKMIALTFDDGPHATYTEEILDILKEYDAHATFFTVGDNVKRFPEIVDREIAEGHEVANHTLSHKHMAKLGEGELEYEILECENLLYSHNEYTPRLFRPPEGVLSEKNSKIIAALGYDIVLWSIDTRDWSHTAVDKIVNNVLKNAENGSIILFHDFIAKPSPTPEALRIILPKLKEQGYEFVCVSELISNRSKG